jgi:transposase
VSDKVEDVNLDVKYAELSDVKKEALNACEQLCSYTNENFQSLEEKDCDKIKEIIERRDPLIANLMDIEKKVGHLYEKYGACDEKFAEEIDALKKSVRAVLDPISQLDLLAISILERKMQEHKDKVLSIQSKKSISTYLKNNSISYTGSNFDIRK